ncbi:small RNA degrading nuclease 1-like [Populus alba x Populus x berolinensis]|uniref:Small RNA degrading nuclease 1-like n=1 Tax=Populus alba x Populus x berolinensis TaxID=444605 RepID=A0AAD6QH50_9ROSI|nr:small RNA degrading nuclease 1-like [Populus alba x Populus x berolinensis]
MDKNLLANRVAAASDKVLAEVVKLTQKQGRRGSQGTWKQFLNVYEKKFGSGFSDPARRSRDSLVAFLQTFTDEDGLKFVDNVLRSLSNCETLKETMKESLENESPEQRLVRSTLEHPLYLSKYALPTYEKGWAVTKVRKKPKLLRCNKMLAVDCEMVLCKDGTDALVRVCVVDADLKVKLDELVNPCKPVEDYRTEITGVTAEVLDGASCSFGDIQISMKKLLSRGTILVGHSLYNDLQALKVDHARVIDTSFIFKSSDGRSPSLNNLCKCVLGYELRKAGDPHNCLDDACAAMKLVLAKIERGVDNYIPLIQPDVKDASYNVPEIEMAKLLLHKIPVTVPREKLRRLFPANYTIEIKTHKVIQGVGYSVLAIFKNPEEACQAFENLIGSLEKDTSGRPQKLVALQLDTGGSAGIRVRKMTHDSHVSQKKRSFEGEDSSDPKKPKIGQCDDHLKEIERLKQELEKQELNQCDDHSKEIERLKQEIKTKDFEITAQDKIITELKRKLEEMKKKKNKER